MKKKNGLRIFSIILLTVLVISIAAAIPQTVHAFGDFSSHSDYGGSSSHSHSDSSSGSGSGGFDLSILYHFAEMISDALGIGSPIAVLIFLILIIVGIRFLIAAKGKTKHEGSGLRVRVQPDSLQKLNDADPAFSMSDLTDRVKDLFEKMQDCWEAGNIDPLRKDFMPDTWTRFNTQLQNKTAAGETTHVSDIEFDQVTPLSYATDSEHQILKIQLDVTHNVWTTNRKGDCTEGTEKTRKRFEFIWTLMRPLDAKTGGVPVSDTTHCPNCGAEIDLEAFAECPFCHTPVMKISPDWVISEIDAISQQTIHN